MNTLKEFKAVLSDWRHLGPYLVAGSTALPLLDLLVQLGPAWPAGATVLFSLVAVLANLWAFHVIHRQQATIVDRSLRRSVGVSLVCLAAYLAAWSALTVQVPAHNRRIPIGWGVQPGAERAIEQLQQQGVPLSDAAGLLNNAIEDGEDPLDAPLGIWTAWTVHVSRFVLVLLWSGLVSGLCSLGIAFTIYHRQHTVERKAAALGRAPARRRRNAALIVALAALATVGRASAQHLQALDLSSEYDRRSRQELDPIDASFMRWQFPSLLRWTADGENSARPLDGIVINKRNVQAYNQLLSAEDWWMPITFALAHEKTHLVQVKKYGNAAEQYPEVVREAQADVMAAAYVFLRIMRLRVEVTADNRVVITSEAPQRDPAAFVAARTNEVFDLIRLGHKLGRIPGDDHPEGWERGQAVMDGLLAGTGMLRLHLGQLDAAGLRREFGFGPEEDFADWSLRKAYEIVGLPLGARTASVARFTVANAPDPIGLALRRAVETAPRAFEPLRVAKVSQDEDSFYFTSTVRLPEFHRASIEVDREDPKSATVRFSKEREFPEDIELGIYSGLKKRIARLLRDGWTASPERTRDTAVSQRWRSPDSTIEIAIVHYPRAAQREVSLRVWVEHLTP